MGLITRLQLLRRNVAAQDLLEYALLAALIALVAYAAVETTGGHVSDMFTAISTKVAPAAGAGA